MGTKNIQHCHSMYSLNDSALTPYELVKKAKDLGTENIVLTDHGTLLGVNKFMDAGAKLGINTIPGVEAYCKGREHLILIPKNYKGFQAISYAMRDANQYMADYLASERVKGKKKSKGTPIMTDETLVNRFKGNPNVIATSACIQGPIASILLRARKDKRIAKQQKTLVKTEAAYEEYKAIRRKKQENADKLKKFRSYRTAQMKFQKPAHKAKIERLQKKIDSLPDGDSKAIKPMEQLISAQNDYKTSCEILPGIERAIETLQAEKAEIAEKIKMLSTGYKAYEKAKKAIAELPTYDEAELYDEAKERLLWLKSVFPNFFVEVQYHGLDNEAYVMPILVKLGKETNTPLIAANDAHMADNSYDSVEARRIMRFNYFGHSQVAEEADQELYLKSDEELSQALLQVIDPDSVNEAMQNLSILEQCKVEFASGKHYPKVKTGKTLESLIENRKKQMIDAGQWSSEIESRVKYELDTINAMGYADYHLIVEEFCRIGRLMGYVPKDRRDEIPNHFADLEDWVSRNGFHEGVGIGPGRGSAAGSKVCNLIGITNIDPLKYDLLFQRYLNPERISMPDIDTDIATSIRPYLIAYLQWCHGEKSVCSIATENVYGAKGALKLAGRDRADQLFNHLPMALANEEKKKYNRENTYVLADMIPEGAGETLAAHETEFANKYGMDTEKSIIWNHAKLVEGKLFTTGVHAGGIIISDNDNVNEYVPLAWNDEKGVWVAQCDMVQAEEKGLLKMDLLGLSTLDCISDTLHFIKKYKGIDINIDAVDFEQEVFENIYSKGRTNSVFQFESPGMKDMLTQFKPTRFEDIILLVAAYRPGPMQYLDNIIAVKNGERKLTFRHEKLRPLLAKTYGATIYQEQVMQIFQDLAGFSLGAADLVRRAMSKKKLDKLAHERVAFVHGDPARNIDGCVNRGISEETANQLFDEMMDFAKYAFNKSHAAAYAYVSYQTAWLKYHYPVEFLCAMFNNKEQKDYAPLLEDCHILGVKLLPPDINASFYDFVIEGDSIRFGFRGIKGIGDAVRPFVQNICKNREKETYKSIQDCLKKNIIIVQDFASILPHGIVSAMINVGMFDAMGYNRESLDKAFDQKFVVKRENNKSTEPLSDQEMY